MSLRTAPARWARRKSSARTSVSARTIGASPSCRRIPSWASASTRSLFRAPSRAKPSTKDENARPGSGSSDRARASSTNSRIRSSTTASNKASLVGKCRYTVPAPTPSATGDLIERHVRAFGAESGTGGLEHAVSITPRVGTQRASLAAVDGRKPGAGHGGVGSRHQTDLLAPANGACVPYSVNGVFVPFPSKIAHDPQRGTAERTDRPARPSRTDRA